MARLGSLLACLFLCACSEPVPSIEAPDASTATAPPPASAASGAPPAASSSAPRSIALEGPPLIALDVPGFEPAVLAVPVGASDRRRLFLATHGNFDRPEWQCEVWSEILEHRHFVLCPRGIARPDSPPDDPRFTYRTNKDLEREVDAATAALRETGFAGYLEDDAPVWTGFSLGAIMGVAIAARRASDFPELVLVEGGVDRFGDDQARAFARGGGKRVLFACAQAGCAKPAKRRAEALEKLGVRATVVDAGAIGHTYDGPVAKAVAAALPGFLGLE